MFDYDDYDVKEKFANIIYVSWWIIKFSFGFERGVINTPETGEVL